MALIDTFIERARQAPRTVVFPEGTDDRILHSAAEVKKAGIAEPILIGDRETLLSAGCREEIRIIDPARYPGFSDLVSLYVKHRPSLSEAVAGRLVKKPLAFAGMLVASGTADAMVAGAANPTARVIQAAALTVGYEEGITTPSSFFIMALADGGILFFADCAVNIAPEPEQLADIAVATAGNCRKLTGDEPRVAFLSFSSKGSASHELVDRVIEGLRIAQGKSPGTFFDGELQADAALVERVARKKLKEPGEVAGRANVLVFPDLQSGNIAYKLTQYLAGAEAYGPILQGFAKPVSDLSRGAGVKDIVGITAITCLQAQKEGK